GVDAADAAAETPGTAERRQITVMFCDLVGSTALSQRLDPEDLRNLMQRYQQTCGAVIERQRGTVAQYLGDGLMVYFGWPRAYEDDAQRAVAAALQLVDAVKTIASAQPLQVRIGLATGPVVVGQGAGSGDASSPRLAVGETPNLAARVQGLAEPDQVLAAAATWRLLGGAFDGQDLGEHRLKGIDAPVGVFRVLGESAAEGRFAAAHGAGLTPMINRELELSLLRDRWARVCDGQGQAVLLVGEPGIGKCRVLAELCDMVRPDSLLLRVQCSEQHANTAFHPLAVQLLRAAGIERDDAAALRYGKLEALLERHGMAVPRHAPYFAALLSLPAGHYPPLQASPAKVRTETIDAFVQWVLDAARQRPVLVLLEDLHWMDPTTLQWVDALMATLRRAPVLLVMTSRTSLAGRWSAQTWVTTLGMVGLNREHSMALAGAVALAHGLQDRLVQRIVEHTDGVPLFLEELTRALAERAAASGPEAAEAIEIPSTLKASLTARLDQLGAARRALQFGALLGRQFRLDVLQALLGGDAAQLVAGLDQGIAAGLLSRSGMDGDAVYTFHHALIQDAAYDSMLKSERRALHVRAADLLKAMPGDGGETEPELLARHYSAGEAWDQAVALWLRAGQAAWARGAAQEAIAHLEAGIAAVSKVSPPALRDGLELGLQSTLGVVWFAARSYGAPQAQAALERAAALCERIASPAMKVPVLLGAGTFQVMRGDTRAGYDIFIQVAREAEAAGEPRLQLAAQAVRVWSCSTLGLHADAVRASDAVRALAAASGAAGPTRLGAADPRVLSECFSAVSQWSMGQVDAARAGAENLLALARTLDSYSLAYTLCFAALPVIEYCGDVERVLELTEEGLAMAVELGYPFLEVSALIRRAKALSESGLPTHALTMMDEGLSRIEAMGVGYGRPVFLSWRAQMQLALGDVGGAQLTVAQALGRLAQSGNAASAAEVLLTEGRVLLAHGGEQRQLARASFQAAMDEAAAQGAASWRLRAGIELACMQAQDEGPRAGLDLLAPLAAAVKGGRGSRDVDTADRLLRQWAADVASPVAP
ncbi:MAG: ATP-binding protein, partial [Aquabacterium sp.]